MRRRRNNFDLSHENSTTMKMGNIVPIMLTEALPGDSFQFDSRVFLRVAPLVAPVMHKVWMDMYTFFIPWRILWRNWESFITGGEDGMDASVPPTVTLKPASGTLSDYMGLPLSSGNIEVSALPFRAYAAVYNEYFRDQRLQDELPISLEDGPDSTTSLELQAGCWQKDYFTTANVSPQLGPQVTIPVQGVAGSDNLRLDVVGTGIPSLYPTLGAGIRGKGSDLENVVSLSDADGNLQQGNNGWYNLYVNMYDDDPSTDGVIETVQHQLQWKNPALSVSLEPGSLFPSGIGSIGINDFREAMALQRWREKRANFGARYEDLLRFWGLSVQDSRLQLPELIGTRHGTLQFSEVLQTSPDTPGSGVGALFGHGIGALQQGRHRYYCPEHGLIMTVMIVRPKAVYTQGIERMWSRTTRYDYWNPEFEHIGQQEILTKEIFAAGTEADNAVWGYQNRYDEYRRGKNHVTGEFRTTLEFWNMARIFENAPNLNSEFVTCNPTDRIYQLSADLSDQLYVMVQNNIIAKRLMSRNGNPI